jgi:dolichol-phosphate mannosyltransferase
MNDKTLIIVGTYNEAANIVNLISQLQSLDVNIDILVIDDNSPDGTAQAVKELKNKYNNINIIERSSKLGLGTALITGFKEALRCNYKKVITMDADLSHQPKYIPDMIKTLDKYNLVIGSRYTKNGGTLNWSLRRRILSRWGNIYTKMILQIPICDLTAGFAGIDTDYLKKINLDNIQGTGYAFQGEIKYKLYKTGAKVKEIPIIFQERTMGQSKVSSNIIKEGLIMPWKLKFKK